MNILLCNPQNTQATRHSRKGMYPPLGILSIATCINEKLGTQVNIDVIDEDVELLKLSNLNYYDIVGFYSTTFNYSQALKYAYFAKEAGCITVLGGPHPTVLAKNILKNRSCFDYILLNEAEWPFVSLIQCLIQKERKTNHSNKIANLAYKNDNGVVIQTSRWTNSLLELPIASRKFINFDSYVKNYHSVYRDKKHIRPGSIYSSKGCSWRDKTGGCIFCARLEEGVRFRNIDHIWSEIEMLKDTYRVNYIWDIADDNLNNKEWFIDFVKRRPESCRKIKFFIYSRVIPIKPWVIEYFHELNVEEVFLGVESGDDSLLKNSFKGQTKKIAFKAMKLLNENRIKFFPSFVLGLPGESKQSLQNTIDLCKDISELGGLDRMSSTILKPIPGSPAFYRVLNETLYGKDLSMLDEVDLAFLERYWIEQFTHVSYNTILNHKEIIDTMMSKYQAFGSAVTEKNTK